MPTPPAAMQRQDQLRIEGAAPMAAQLDLDTLLNLAMRNNPTLRQARTHVSAELGKALEAGLYPNPMLQYSGELIGAPNASGARTPGEFQGGIVQQEIVTGRKLQLSREKYLQRARISEHLAVAQQYKVLNDVRMHYYRALAAAEILRIRRELVKAADDGALTARELYNAGQARRPEVRQADIALQRARLDLLTADNEFMQRFQELISLVGIHADRWQLAGQLVMVEGPIEFEAALGHLWTRSPQLAAARAKFVADQITVRREEAQWIPDLTFSGGTGYNFETPSTVSMAGLQFDVPLFDRNQGTVRQAQADLIRQRNEIARVELQLRMHLAEVHQRYLTAYQHATEYERVILPEARAAYRELLEGYKANRAEWPDVLDAQRDYFDAQQDYIHAMEMYRVNEVLILGFLLHNGLEAAPGPTPPGHIDAVPKPR
jgi:outer membrane protein TolC